MVDQTLERFGQLDILVNNAGILRDNLVFKMTDDDWDRVIGVHLRGAFLCARAAQKSMVERKHGRIISLSSTSALGNRGQINYSAAKAGLQGLTRTLAIELGPFGITANAIAPGFIDTDMTRSTAERLGATPSSSRRHVATHSAAPHRPAERGRQRGGVPRLRRRQLCQRASHLRRRRPGGYLDVICGT